MTLHKVRLANVAGSKDIFYPHRFVLLAFAWFAVGCERRRDSSWHLNFGTLLSLLRVIYWRLMGMQLTYFDVSWLLVFDLIGPQWLQYHRGAVEPSYS